MDKDTNKITFQTVMCTSEGGAKGNENRKSSLLT